MKGANFNDYFLTQSKWKAYITTVTSTEIKQTDKLS